MTQFKNRKLLLLLLLFALIFAVYTLVPYVRGVYAVLLCVLLLLACIFFGGGFGRGIRNLVFILLALATAVSSLIYAANTEQKSTAPLAYADGAEHEILARITEVSYIGTYSASYYAEVNEVGGEKTSFNTIIDLEWNAVFEYGDIISCRAVFEKAEAETAYLSGKNIFVRMTAEDAVRKGKAEKDIEYYLHTANSYLCGRMIDMIGEESGGFCAALILGNRSHVSAGMRLAFSRAGISHLLALSGLHLSVIAQTLGFLLRGFLKKKPRNVILIVCCFAFALFTGLSLSVLRAAVMLAFVFAADMAGEENDSLTALFAAVFVIFLVNGNAVYDVAFWLSCCATLGIILVRPAADALFAKWHKPKKNALLRSLHAVCKYFYGIFTMSAAAIFFTLPVMAFSFGETSAIGILSDFIFLPLAAVLLVACILFVPLSFVPKASALAAWVCKSLSELLILLAEKISDLRGICISLNYPFAPYLFALLAAAIFLCIFVKKLSAVKLCALVLSFAVTFGACFGVYKGITAGDVRVIAGSENGREFVAMDAGGECYVVDISTGSYSFMYGALASVKELAYTEVDNLVLTHYHTYHQNSIYRLSDIIKIRKVILPKPETEAEEENFLLITRSLERLEIDFEVYVRGEVYENGEVSIDFAPLRYISRSEKPLAAFKLTCGGSTFSYIEGAALESNFDYSAFLSADTVFVGSHGPARKFGVSASVLADAGRVIFAEGAREYFRDTEYLARVYEMGDYGGRISILYDN